MSLLENRLSIEWDDMDRGAGGQTGNSSIKITTILTGWKCQLQKVVKIMGDNTDKINNTLGNMLFKAVDKKKQKKN